VEVGMNKSTKHFHADLEVKPKKCAGCKCYKQAWEHLMAIRDRIDEEEEYLMSLEERRIVYTHQDLLFNSAPYSPERILEAACYVEETPNCGVYFLIRGDDIVYVGQSRNCPNRIQTHINDKQKVFDRYTFVVTDVANLNFLESWYIYAFKPEYNKRAPLAWPELVEIGTEYMEKRNGKNTSLVVQQN
jgi:predicted GIY-YIG superfamily endonuclease